MGDGTPLNLHLAARHAVEARGKKWDAGITVEGLSLACSRISCSEHCVER